MFHKRFTILCLETSAVLAIAALLLLPAMACGQILSSPAEEPSIDSAETDIEVPPEKWEQNLVGSSRSVADEPAAGTTSDYVARPDVGKAVLALLAVLAVMIVGAYILRRFKLAAGRIAASSGVEVLSRSSISSKQSICLVKCGPRLLFVGVSPNHMAVLDRVDDPDEIARITGLIGASAAGSITNTFTNLFRRESREYEHADDFSVAAEPAEPVVPEKNDWHEAQAEVDDLLDKVKGIKRLSIRPRR